jgi:homoserine O-acetyltransferase
MHAMRGPVARSSKQALSKIWSPPTPAISKPHLATKAPHTTTSTRYNSSQASRRIHQNASRQNTATAAYLQPDLPLPQAPSSNPPLSFPCLDNSEARSASLSQKRSYDRGGPEPSYTTGAHKSFHSSAPLLLDWGGVLPKFKIAYETWGELNAAKDNAILLHTGLSASSHAHSTPENPQPGWWEKFIGPGKPLDTDRYFVICTNVVGGCYGSTGPASLDPADGQPYATRFPILTMEDMVRAQFRLLDHLHIQELYASVGSSMGGMQSLAAGVLFPERVARVVSVSGCARSHPYSIAMRHTQRQVLMNDPHWNRGFYYDGIPPHSGMKLARQIATVTYRSGPEWEARFGRRRADDSRPPALCPDFLIETYLDHAGDKWCLTYDPNSLLYVSKAMDLFDLGAAHRKRIDKLRSQNEHKLASNSGPDSQDVLCTLSLPEEPYQEVNSPAPYTSRDASNTSASSASSSRDPPQDLVAGLEPLRNTPTLVLGVASDILFPAWQQREIYNALQAAGNQNVSHVELGEDKSLFGHDTFLLDLEHVGGAIKQWLG